MTSVLIAAASAGCCERLDPAASAGCCERPDLSTWRAATASGSSVLVLALKEKAGDGSICAQARFHYVSFSVFYRLMCNPAHASLCKSDTCAYPPQPSSNQAQSIHRAQIQHHLDVAAAKPQSVVDAAISDHHIKRPLADPAKSSEIK